jgi:hypothetical protein
MASRKATDRPDQDETLNSPPIRTSDVGLARGPGSKQPGVADADKKARTGSEQESVRNTPPAGDWNDVA